MKNIVEGQSEWFLVYTKPNQEKVAKHNLQNQGFRVFLPLIIRHKKRNKFEEVKIIEALFPRYLFIKINPKVDDISFIRSTFGVSKLVLFGDVSVSSVPKKVINELKNLLDSKDTFEEQIIEEDYQPGDELVIKKGAAKGMKAVFMANSGKNRVKLLIQRINKSISADLKAGDIGKKEIVKTIEIIK